MIYYDEGRIRNICGTLYLLRFQPDFLIYDLFQNLDLKDSHNNFGVSFKELKQDEIKKCYETDQQTDLPTDRQMSRREVTLPK